MRKTHVNDDDQRANQSIFICFFHWGVHGWIPYILLAINASIVWTAGALLTALESVRVWTALNLIMFADTFARRCHS